MWISARRSTRWTQMYSGQSWTSAEIPPKLVKLISGLFTGTESAVMCDGTISDYFPFNTVVRQGYVLASTPSNVRMDHVLRAMSKTSGCGVYFGAVRITNPDWLTLRTTRLYSRRQPKFLRRHLSRWARKPSRWDCESPGSRPRSRHSVTSCMRPLSQFLWVARMWKSRRRLPTLAAWFTRLPAAKWKSIDDWDEPGARWIRWTKVCGAAETCAKERTSEFWARCCCCRSCSIRARAGPWPASSDGELHWYYVASLNRWLLVAWPCHRTW